MNTNPVRVRFAPSPTGKLHAGGLRTALFNYLFRLKQGGSLILRIEDTDQDRDIAGSAESILRDFAWAGVKFDEGFGFGGAHEPYNQSARNSFYQATAQALVSAGAAYRCFCPADRLSELRANAQRNNLPPRYDRLCRNPSTTQSSERAEAGEPFVIRLTLPMDSQLVIDDLVKGEITFRTENLDDIVIIRTDGRATSILAGAVDDQLMAVSHILRGDEWLASAPYQLLINRYMGWEPPLYGHLPLLLGEHRAKLSKRDPGGTVDDLRSKGYLPEAICRTLFRTGRKNIPANLGWELNQLAEQFELTDYNSGDSVFSMATLETDNGDFIRQMDSADLLNRSSSILSAQIPVWDSLASERQLTAVKLLQGESHTIIELTDKLKRLISPEPPTAELFAPYPRAGECLSAFCAKLQGDNVEWSAVEITKLVKATGKELVLNGKELYAPIRIALTGSEHGPALADIVLFLGKDEVVKRLLLDR